MFRLIRQLLRKKKRNQKSLVSSPQAAPQKQSNTLSPKLEHNKERIRSVLGTSEDIILRHIHLVMDNGSSISALLVGIDGMLDETAVRQDVLQPLMQRPLDSKIDLITQVNQRLYLKKIEMKTDFNQIILDVIKGSSLLLVEGLAQGWILHTEGFVVRSIDEPPTEVVVKGPREGFVESFETNVILLRRRIPHPSLRFESMILGEFSQTNVTIAYIEGIAEPRMIEDLKVRLREIKSDSVMSSGELEQFIEDAPYSIFPTVGNTERPDRAAAMILEGRIAILVDGDPVALFVPHLFLETIQSPEDYSSRPYLSSFIRLLRFTAFLFSITLPSIYILAVNFHKEVIPSELIVSLTESRQRVPFPLVMELLGLTIIFEIVREAGVRMPRAIGQAVSIVGALILGQVSVQAGFIGAPTIIVVALAAVTSFIVTPVAEVAALLRVLFIIPTSMFGFFGFLGFELALLTHMVSLTSMGVPYLAPFSPFHFRDWGDSVIRLPYQKLRERPVSIPNLRPRRIEKLPKIGKGKDKP